MSGMARRLLDEMKQNPPYGAALGIGKPWSLWKADALPEVADALYYRIRSRTDMVVLPKHGVEAFILGQDKARQVRLECVLVKRRTLNPIGPTAFSEGEVLDKATEA
jgi:hypothetical protein